MKRNLRLRGTVVLVTGASSGIGKAASLRFAERGAEMNCARAVLPHMKERGRGTIVNIASLYAEMTSPYVGAYATSKFGVLGFTDVLRQELKRHRGLKARTVLPRSVDTPIFGHAPDYTGRRVKPPPPESSPARVVRVIVRNPERPRRRVVVDRTHRLSSLDHSLTPWIYNSVVHFATKLLALGRHREPDSEGDVFEPLPPAEVEGGRRHWPKRLAVGAGGAAAGTAVALGARAIRSGRRDIMRR